MLVRTDPLRDLDVLDSIERPESGVAGRSVWG